MLLQLNDGYGMILTARDDNILTNYRGGEKMDQKKLKSREEFVTYQTACRRYMEEQKRKIYVCCGSTCMTEGAMKIYSALKQQLELRKIPCTVELGDYLENGGVGLSKVGCVGFCSHGPLIRIDPEGWLYTKVMVEDVEEIIQTSIVEGKYISRLGFDDGMTITKRQKDITFFQSQTRRILKNCGEIDAERIDDAIAHGGYEALVKALFDISEEDILREIETAGLRGRGGIGSYTIEKWRKLKNSTDPRKTLVVNDGKSAIGSYMDSGLLEGDPHKAVEGIAVICIACGVTDGYAYIHPQYQTAVYRLKTAVKQAESLGFLGDDILGSGKRFRLHINNGMEQHTPEEYMKMYGHLQNREIKWFDTVYLDETGRLQNATESNNLETIVNVPDIINYGAEWFRSLGTEESPGTKVFMLTGAVNNIGMVEIPFGTTVRQMVEDIGGGMANSGPFRAVRLSGSTMLMRENLDMPITFEDLEELGDRIGTGNFEVMDGKRSMMETAKYLLRFASRGSCGRCTPCREGLPRMTFLLDKLSKGEGSREDMDEVIELANLIQSSALCFETCATLGGYEIDPALCVGCTKCARNCPVMAIHGTIRQPHEIDKTKCIKCGACFRGCPKHAVKENDPWKQNI